MGVELDYIVPEEGSTVWFDGWVIPKYAKNTKAATFFINFMCRPDIAIRNMEETGYVASNAAPEVLDSQIDESLEPIDLSYFFGPEASSVRVDPILYPDKAVIERCALEHDWGEDTERLLAMWQTVKGSQTNTFTFVVIGVVLLAAIIYFVSKSQAKKSRKRKRR